MNRRVAAAIAFAAALITIFAFATGIFSLPQLLREEHDTNTFPALPNAAPDGPTGTLPVGKVLSGTASMSRGNMYSFSTAQVVSRAGDLRFSISDWGTRLRADGGLLPLGAQPLRSIRQVPAAQRAFLSSNYEREVKLVVGNCYAVRCADESHYAIFRIIALQREGDSLFDPWRIDFEWRYQTDGSSRFAPE